MISLTHVGVILFMVAVAVLLPFVLSRLRWYRFVVNWWMYGRWIDCRHPAAVFRLHGDSTMETTNLWESACTECGMVFLVDTLENWYEARRSAPHLQRRRRLEMRRRHWRVEE